MGGGLTVQVLGPVEAHGPAGPISVSGEKLQVLLALLALHAPHVVSADRLIDEMWGDQQPANPANSLQAQVSQLRRLLGRDAIVRRGNGYALDVEPDQVDARRFTRLAAAGRDAVADGDPRGGAQLLRAALALVRGPVLADLLDREVISAAAAALEEEVLVTQEALGDAELAAGRHAEVVAALTDLVRAHPLRERFAAQLVVALYRSGRQVDALQAYAQVREALIEEFGVEPGVELRDLEAKVLAHDPSLAAPVVPPTTARAPGPGAVVAPGPGPGFAPGAQAASVPSSTHDSAFHHTPGRLPLVGRETELEAGRSDLADALRGRGRVIVLVGEPGIGKTRLAEEIAEEGEQVGATIGWGRSHAGWGDVAFRTWAQILATLIERAPAEVVAAALGRGAAVLAQISPEVHDVVPDLDVPPPLDAEGSRARVCEALTGFVRALAHDRPVIVTLDDLQWADTASLQALGHLAREITDVSVLLVVTYRSVGAPATARLVDTLALLVRQPIVRRVDVGGLELDAIASLVAASGGTPDAEVVRAVHRRTQGNAFFALEVVRSLGSGGEGGLEVPSGVRDVIRDTVAQLPPPTVELLGSAAVLGLEIDPTTVALALRIEPAEVLSRLQPALDAGVVLAGRGPFGMRFSHGLVAETLYADLPLGSKLTGHLRAADALEARHGTAGGAHLADIASHRCQAVPVGATDDAVRACVRAATWLVGHLAHDEAEDLLSRALELVAAMAAGKERDAAELELLDRLWLLRMMTKGFGTEGAVEAITRMGELCEAIGDADVVAPVVWRLVNYLCVAAEFEMALELSRRLLAAPSDDPTVAHSAHLAMGITLTHLGEVGEARPHFAAVADGPIEPDGGTEAAYGAWNRFLGGDDGAVDDLAAIAAAQGVDAYPTAITGWFATLLAALRRDPDATLERCERWMGAAQHQGMAVFVPYMAVCRGWAVAVRDDVDLGVAEMEAAAKQIEASGTRMLRNVFHGLRADALLTAGRPEEALVAADAALGYVERYGERWFEAELHRLRGAALAAVDPSDPEAVAAVRRAVEVAAGQGSRTFGARAEATLAGLTGLRG